MKFDTLFFIAVVIMCVGFLFMLALTTIFPAEKPKPYPLVNFKVPEDWKQTTTSMEFTGVVHRFEDKKGQHWIVLQGETFLGMWKIQENPK